MLVSSAAFPTGSMSRMRGKTGRTNFGLVEQTQVQAVRSGTRPVLSSVKLPYREL